MIKSAYIHIPFCDSICSYCDFCKFIKNEKWVNAYLNILKCEIEERYNGEILDTIYIGGGTPSSLSIEELNKLFNVISILKKSNNIEFTFECNIESITKEKLELLYKNGINRLSIGIQTFNSKYLNYLNRHHNNKMIIEKINIAKEIGFKNINIDLIYAIPGETIEELNKDLDLFLKLGIPHISTYSLMIEPNTKLFINNEECISEDLDYEMYKLICDKLELNGYNHYEISNFGKIGYESKHNLTYWNNQEYYGFGIGASGYINSIRYDNTKSLNKYLNKIYINDKHKLDRKEKIENEFILGFRKMRGIDKQEFKIKYNIDIKSIESIKKLLNEHKLLEDKKNIYINSKYIYVSNEILINFIS